MSGGPSIFRHQVREKSNAEFLNSLRENIASTQDAVTYAKCEQTLLTNGAGHDHDACPKISPRSLSLSEWTSRDDNVLMIPSMDWSTTGLREERSKYNVTVKIFVLPSMPADNAPGQIVEAIRLVCRELRIESIDLVVASFPNMRFEAGCEVTAAARDEAPQLQDSESLLEVQAVWKALENLHTTGLVAELGVSEFGTTDLKTFIPMTVVKPTVDQINVTDCCNPPTALVKFCKTEGIRLLMHTDCTNILPSGTLRELLGQGENGFAVLADSSGGTDGLPGDVEPWFVVKYTAIVIDRGVIENKGYFAVADLKD
jgi:glutamate--cysteine ligase regulatory subunit